MVKIKNIGFRYSDEDVILDKASIDISKNKITVILGRNGVGKTTLLSLIDGFLTHDQGELIKDDESIFI